MTRYLLAAGALIVALPPQQASAYCRLSTGNPEPMSGGACDEAGHLLAWQAACVSYSVVDRERAPLALAEVRDTVDQAFATWMTVTCEGRALPIDLRQTEALSRCAEAEHNETDGNVNTIAFLDDWVGNGFPQEAFGLTLVWHEPSTGRIVGADMLLNDETMGRFATCAAAGCAAGDVDLRNVVTHEAGHFLGLGHSDRRNASMYWQARAGEVKKRQLDADDRAGLCTLYGSRGAREACTSRDFVPPGGFDPACGGQVRSGCACALTPAPERTIPGGLTALGVLALAALLRLRRRV